MYVNVNVKEIMFIPVARRVKGYTKLVRIKKKTFPITQSIY